MVEAVSVNFELTQLQRALLCVEELCRSLSEGPFEDVVTAGKAASAVAVIGLVESRLRLLQRVVCEELDPALLLSHWNAVPADPSPGDDADLLLKPWPLPERLRRARETVGRLERQSARGQRSSTRS